jgi:23S rRNA U2552 (ribose-2'-O)-methylase RlmE/FtsJ
MSLLRKKILHIRHPDRSLHDIQIHLQPGDKILEHNSQLQLYKLLSKYKINIDAEPEWNQMKKVSNIFEYLYIYNKYLDSNIGVALHNPISRSFFKLYEMIQDLDLLDFSNKTSQKETLNVHSNDSSQYKHIHTNSSQMKLSILGLAEAPGGFMESMYTYRKKQKCFNQDEYYTMSLISEDDDVPSLHKLKNIIKDNKLTLIDGVDGTGSLYNYKNIQHLRTVLPGKVDIVTADGGFNFCEQYNYQEQLSYKLIFSEIIGALYVLKKGGHFVLKIFDIFTDNTIDLLYFLSRFFTDVYIIKPFSSRPANSEKYIVSKGFLGIDETLMDTLLETLLDWNVINHNGKYVQRIFSIKKNKVYKKIKRAICDYNTVFVKEQIKNILTTLVYIKSNMSYEDREKIYYTQASMCFFWCLKYHMELNPKCKYLK